MPVVNKTDSFPLRDHWIRVVDRPLGENIRARVARAASIAENGRREEAIRLLENLLPTGNKEPSLFYTLGLAHEDAGRQEDALRFYRRALELEPDMVAARINGGSILLAQKNLEAAVEEFRKAIEINPLEMAAHYNLAIALQMKGDSEGVQRALRMVVAIDPRIKEKLR
jgi:Flp pilus assembly protein TadD